MNTCKNKPIGIFICTKKHKPCQKYYATKYNLESDIIAAAMVACTFVSAPIMFISAKLLSLKNINPEDYLKVLGTNIVFPTVSMQIKIFMKNYK